MTTSKNKEGSSVGPEKNTATSLHRNRTNEQTAYRPLARQVGKQTEQLRHLLDEDVFLELEEYLDLRDRVESMHMEASFQYGFRLGANLMIEVLNKRGEAIVRADPGISF